MPEEESKRSKKQRLKSKIRKRAKGDSSDEEKDEDPIPSSSLCVPSSSSSPSSPFPPPSPSLKAAPETGELEGAATATLKEEKVLSSLHLDRNSVILSVVSCKDLKNVDLIGKSDPFVKIKILDRSGMKERAFKTKRIDNDLNPVWDEDFMFIFKFGRSLEDYLLQLEVYDHDKSRDTFLGMCIQPMVDVVGKRPGRVTEMKLEPKKEGQNVKGTIQFSIRFPSPQEIEELGVNFSSKVAKSLVNYVTYSCADSICKIRPDAAIFECEAEVTVLNIVFIYILNILIPIGAPTDMFEIRKEMAYESLKGSVAAKTSTKGRAVVGNLPEDTQKMLKNFLPKFIDQVTPVLEASRKAPADEGGTEVQMGVGIKPIIRLPPPPSPTVVGARVALRTIFASQGKGAPPPPPTTFSALAVATTAKQALPVSQRTPSPRSWTPKSPALQPPPSEPRSPLRPPSPSPSPSEGPWKPKAENIGMLDVENNFVVIRVEDVSGLKHKDITGKCKPFVMVEVMDRSGNLSKKFKTDVEEGQDATFEKDFLFIFPFGRSVEDFIVSFSVFHHSLKGKRFLGYCERPVVDILAMNKAVMEIQPRKQGDYVKGTATFSIRSPTGEDIEEIGASITSKITKHLVSFILFSCADAIVKGITLPSSVRFECEAEITVLNICFIFILNVAIPYGAPPDIFSKNKNISYENLRIGVAVKGVPKMFSKVPESAQTMVDSYLPRFMEQLLIVIESSRKPMGGDPVFMEFGVGMKPGLSLPLPPNPPIIKGEIAFRVFLGVGGAQEDTSVPQRTFRPILNNGEEMKQRKEAAEAILREAHTTEGPMCGIGALDLKKGAMVIKIVSAHGLRNVDLKGESDPLVKITIVETSGSKVKKFRTKVIENNLNPVWDENFFFVFPVNRTADDLALVLEVYDKGFKGKTFLGMCEQSMTNILRNDPGKIVEMPLQPKKKGDYVKGTIRFSLHPPTSQDIEDLGADSTSKLARCLVSYIAFSFANVIVKARPKDARFECETKISVFGISFLFCATVVIPFGTAPDVFETKKDLAFEQLKICVATQGKKLVKKIPQNAESLLASFLPKFMEQATPLIETSRNPDNHSKIQAQTGVGIMPEFALPFPPSPPVVTGSVALKAVFGVGPDSSAAPFRSFAFHPSAGGRGGGAIRVVPQ